jgi:putative transposase
MGLIHVLLIHPADVQDRDGALLLLENKCPKDFPRMKKLWVDSGYAGRCERAIEEKFRWDVEVVRRPGEGVRGVWCLPGLEPPLLPRGFQVVKWRWIVERTFGWLNRFRRLSKDYEQLPESSAAFVLLSMCTLMIRRLVPS